MLRFLKFTFDFTSFVINKFTTAVIFLFFNSILLHAHNTSDTIITVHNHILFYGYGSHAQMVVVVNNEFNASTKKWTVTMDLYGHISKDDYEFNKMKKEIHFENLYEKEILNGTWVKGDSVKNGYWIQYDYDFAKIREGFVVNGLRENKWIEYDSGIKIGEGNYLHGKKEGVWIEWVYNRRNIYSEKKGIYKNDLKQGEWLEYPYSLKTGEKSSVGRKILYLNDTLTGNYKKNYLVKYNKESANCAACSLLKENLIYISLRGKAAENMYQIVRILDSLNLDLYSDKVLRTYTDESGKTKILTVREHNQNVFAGQWWTGMGRGFEGPQVNLNTLVVEKKQGAVNGFIDTLLKQLKQYEFIGRAMPLCTYTLGPDPLKRSISVDNLSVDDKAVILKALKISPYNSNPIAATTYYAYYNIHELSMKEINKLFKILIESNSVKKIYCAEGYIVNY
ncbi:toxin-antitoxin system YwqK family antitoxin [Cytophaga aurantiaca]|uniref:toxin-antitoxin system YwqK family antitoxin n=1 Tax=Cytophaga aurantiaca TaxID=29530 RepID=UPI00035DE232|nr:hypothetical protein [Cytophaga aurantiaca]